MNDTFKVKFWGVRGSHPTPGPETLRYGGNTACVEVRLGKQVIILDAGTGIIPLGRDLVHRGAPLDLVLLVSHLHHDHTQGFPFFLPAYLPGTRLHIFGPGTNEESLQTVLENNQDPATFPVSLRDMAARKEIRSLLPGRIEDSEALSGIRVDIHKSYAHPGGSYAYRIEWDGRCLVYATDTEGYAGGDRRLAAFARNADLLIHDAQYSSEHYQGALAGFPHTQGFGHSTVEMACELATLAGVGQLALFHHDPAYNDGMLAALEVRAREIFEPAFAAAEGLELNLSGGTRQLPAVPDSTNVYTGAAQAG
ncbi:MAG: MBL fold metallo-hydrolase [Anaerolineales bacterium]|nr:MBL fold metallo-hydrolase [Anaerolineales bacterium]